MKDIEAGILALFAGGNSTITLPFREIFDLLCPVQEYGHRQVRRTLEKLVQQGILFPERARHNTYLFRLTNPVKDKWHLNGVRQSYVPDKVLQDYAQKLFGRRFF